MSEDNPQAFPVSNPEYDGNWNREAHIKGMTLLDYFAAKNMQAFIQSGRSITPPALNNTVKDAYSVARKMLETRKDYL